jgi:putative hydrolase of the HAD superfamily
MKYFVFDVANTLLHKPTLWQKIQEVLQKYQINIDEKELKLRHKILSEVIVFPDKTNKDFYTHFNTELLLSLGIYPDNQLVEAIFENCTYLDWQVFEDTIHIASLIKPLGIISNWDLTLPTKLKKYFPTLHFENIICSAKVGFRKPQKEIFEMALQQFQCQAQDVVFVGDSMRMDIVPSLAMGIQAILIDRENFYPYANVQKIKSFEELLHLF